MIKCLRPDVSRIAAVVVARFRFRTAVASLARINFPVSAKTDFFFILLNISGQIDETVLRSVKLYKKTKNNLNKIINYYKNENYVKSYSTD